MSKLQFMTENLLMNASLSMVTGTENLNFPLTNIPKKFTTKVFRSNENTCEILIDLKQTRAADTFMLAANAVSGFGVTTVTIQGSATTTFTGIPEITVDIDNKYGNGLVQFTEKSVRYWKINLSNTGGYCELSNVFIGKAQVIENNSISISSFRYTTLDNSSTSSNEYGQEFTDVKNKVTEIRGTIQYCNSEEFQLIDDIKLRHTDRTPIWIIMDKDNNTATDGKHRFSGYFSMQTVPTWTSSGYRLFNIPLRFRQVV